MKPLVLTALFIAATSTYVCSQTTKPQVTPQVINTTGGTYKNGYHIIDWSVGELALVGQLQGAGSSLLITNGFLQPNSHDLNAPEPDHLFTYDEIRILPNPTYGMVEINFLTKQQGQVKMILHDRMGNIMFSKEFHLYGSGRFERINMFGYVNGTYMLRIELNPDPGYLGKRGAYKIIKIGR